MSYYQHPPLPVNPHSTCPFTSEKNPSHRFLFPDVSFMCCYSAAKRLKIVNPRAKRGRTRSDSWFPVCSHSSEEEGKAEATPAHPAGSDNNKLSSYAEPWISSERAPSLTPATV